MLFQLDVMEEAFILFYLTIFIIGVQVAIYVFYRYYIIKDNRLPLNKILLSIGLFYLLISLSIFILAISKFFIHESVANEFLYRTGYSLALFSFIGFLYFIIIEDLSNHINLKFTRFTIVVFSILSVSSIIISLMQTLSQILVLFNTALILGLILFGAVYLLNIQLKIIKISKGIIKKRLFKVMIGYVSVIISIFFLLDTITSYYPSSISNIIRFTGLSLFLFALLSTAIGVYAFPTFYDLKWQENVLNLFILNEDNRTCLYNRTFSEISTAEKQKDYENIFSIGIIGIDTIFSAITDNKGEKINKIQHGDSLILLEYGSEVGFHIIYALVVKKDLKSNIYFLKTIKKQFESFYKEILNEINKFKGNEEQLFKSFDIILDNIIYWR